MTKHNCDRDQDVVLEMHAMLDLVDANVAPSERTTEWRRALAFAEDESRADRRHSVVLDEIIDSLGEQA